MNDAGPCVVARCVVMLIAGCTSSRTSTPADDETTASLVPTEANDIVWQVESIDALSAGGFAGTHSVRSVDDHGDVGLGTFDSLDGEMVIVVDVMFQVLSDGSVVEADPALSTPFAQTTTFDADEPIDVQAPVSCDELGASIATVVDDEDAVLALQVRGAFSTLTTRSVPKQATPYAPLADVVADQQVTFELGATDDRRSGGHVLGCELVAGTIEVDVASGLTLDLTPQQR